MSTLFSNISQVNPTQQMIGNAPITPKEAQTNFADTLKGAIENLNNVQLESDKATEALAAGNIDDLHNVMITAQKSSITLEATVQIQKKVIDAYNEIMRMQV
ncbi:flagellar hook-basal body complex protein FliE [Oceanobacillus sp. 143]|jgi:flagellar hook-basal body complex protein FliE|uniref:Flagellar hook-basal body complex protein FliE n=1 Tax=Oceanobacillus zhaokaii TaxID=2052660 RepID=A0A345PGE9_9BACI|nr:flagellar hook-basal body complex protein FliE [Oceanobacillus zhaokaii]AXI09079.1 flagellar hook-basal body complex protein FliE [Oceanobacillus zhaokaii]QGS68648.1 flagellar hook-basal body complex protein FliE [Oceanobacillus sp. 143]